MMLTEFAQDGGPSSDTTSSSDGSSYSGSYAEESVNEDDDDDGDQLVEEGAVVDRDIGFDEERNVEAYDKQSDVVGDEESRGIDVDDANQTTVIVSGTPFLVMNKGEAKELHIDHPAESFPSIVCDDEVEWILSHCCHDGGVEVRIPEGGERPWTVLDGYICVYDFWFTEYHLWFPLPRLLLAYCDAHVISLSQLTPAAIRNMVAVLFTAANIGVHMSLHLFKIWRVLLASWKVCERRMDLSEFSSLVDCFAGGSAITSVVETGQCSNSVEPSAPALGVVMGISRATAPAPSAGKEVVVASGKKVDGLRAASGMGIAVVKNRSAGDRSPKDPPSSKTHKVAPLVEGASSRPFEHAFDGRSSNCAYLFKLFCSPGVAGGYPFDDAKCKELYQEFARHTAIAAKYANFLVYNKDEELAVVNAEFEKANGDLAAAKDVDHYKEVAIWHKKYEAERKVALAARGELDKLTAKMASDAERAKKRYHRAISRHDYELATCNSRIGKVHRFMENQKIVRQTLYGVNQIIGVLDAVKVWRKEGIQIHERKVKHLEEDLANRSKVANAVDVILFEPKEVIDIPSFDFNLPLTPVQPYLTAGVEEVSLEREKEEACRYSDASRLSSDREGAVCAAARQEGCAPPRL
ncbi:hypothetical protein N665_0350s0001 [Sinapis alba]|nr:hypothetical protein N665_0350s0001 [Sinapis alba]